MAQVDTSSPKVRRMLFYVSPLVLWYFWPASTLLHGHIALEIQSFLETDPQILERCGCADEDHFGQIIPSDGFWSRMLAWRNTASVSWTHRIGFSMFELFRKIDEDFGGSISWNTQPSCREFFNIATTILSPFLFWVFARLFVNLAMCIRALFRESATFFLTCRTSTLEDATLHRMELRKFLWGNPCTAVEPFSDLGFCLLDFWFSMYFSHSAA